MIYIFTVRVVCMFIESNCASQSPHPPLISIFPPAVVCSSLVVMYINGMTGCVQLQYTYKTDLDFYFPETITIHVQIRSRLFTFPRENPGYPMLFLRARPQVSSSVHKTSLSSAAAFILRSQFLVFI